MTQPTRGRALSSHAGSWLAGVVGAGATIWSTAHLRAMSRSDWTPSKLDSRRFGTLWARSAGPVGDAVVLLHGLISTGDVFGAEYDRLAETRHLVVPDLLGFGRSMDEDRTSFGVDDHVNALDQMAERAGLFESPRWTLGAHSMGVSLALRWAARHPDRVTRVVGWGAPIYDSPDEARAGITGSAMARLFALDTEMAARACAISCRHRTATGWLSALAEPRLPVPIARAVPLHTWPAYRDAMQRLVVDVAWDDLITTAGRNGVDVRLIWGADDHIGDRGFARRLLDHDGRDAISELEHGDHRLPLTHSAECVDSLGITRA